MANEDRWSNDPERYGGREEDRDRWRRRNQDFDRGGRGDREVGYGRGPVRTFEGGEYGGARAGSSGGYGRGHGEGRGGRHFDEERRGEHGGYRGEESRGTSGRRSHEADYGGNDYNRGFYGADQGYGGAGRDSDLEAAYRELNDRGDGYVGRRRNYGFSGGEERGFWRAATDEVRSWFGDDDAQRHHRGRGPRNYSRSDERIRDDVNDRLTDDPHVDASEIEVTVQGREVTLTGTVNSRFEKRHAEDIAESVSGVTHVQNNLRVQSQANPPMAGSAGGQGMGQGVAASAGAVAGGPGNSTVEVNRSGEIGRKTGSRS